MSRHLIIILLVAFALRLALGLAHPFIFDDSADYLTLGHAIATGHDYCTAGGLYASRMPGYPVLIAGVELIFGNGPIALHALMALQAILGAATCYLVYRLARPMSKSIAILAALLAALDPLSIAFSGAVLTETPFTFLLLLALLMVQQSPKICSLVRTWPLLALTLAGAIYLRASFLPLAFIMLLTPLRTHLAGSPKRPLWPIATTPSLLLLLLLPWIVHNHLRPETRDVRLTSIEGISLYESVYPAADGSPKQDKIRLPADMQNLNEGQRNGEWSRRAWHEIMTHPAHVLALVPIKIARTWSPWINAEGYRQPLAQVLLTLWHIPLYALALASLVVPHLRKKLNVSILLPVFYFTMLHALFLGSVRYRVPLMPLVDILAAIALAELLQKGSKPQLDQRV